MSPRSPDPDTARSQPFDSRRRLLPGFGAAVLVAAQVTLLGPGLIYLENLEEFAGRGATAGIHPAIAFVLVTLILALPTLLPGLARRWTAALLACTVLIWLQSFSTGRYALLDGSEIDWSLYRGREWLELSIWLGAVGAAALAPSRLTRWMWRAAVIVVLVQTSSWALGMARAPLTSAPTGEVRAIANLDELATLSSDRNIIVLVLDGTHGRVAMDVLSGSSELRERFDGFTVLPDHLAVFPTTRFSIPSMLSHELYDNRRPAPDYLEEALTGPASVPPRIAQSGFHVGIASTIAAMRIVPRDVFVPAERLTAGRQKREVIGLELLDLSLFRSFPLSVKRWVFNDNNWRLRRLLDWQGGYHATRSLLFMRTLIGRLSLGGDEPAFRFIHVGGAHPPVVVDGECEFIGVQPVNRSTYGSQVECALRQAADLVEALDVLGVLDSTFLVIVSDHGIDRVDDGGPRLPTPHSALLNRHSALFMLKNFGAVGPLEVDSSPTSMADLPTLLESAAAGHPVDFAPDPAGRTVFHHRWQHGDWRKDYVTNLHAFRVREDASRPESWSYLGSSPSPSLRAAELAEQERVGEGYRDAIGTGEPDSR